MAQYRSQARPLSAKRGRASFIECYAELVDAAAINLKTNDSTKDLGLTWQGLGVFVPTQLVLVATTITAMTVQPQVTFQGVTFTCTMSATGRCNIFNLAATDQTPIAENAMLFFTVAALATATTYLVSAFARGFYTRLP